MIYDAEHFFDGFRANPEYALKTIQAAEEAGASLIVLCDTNGGPMPEEVAAAVDAVRKELRIPVGIHCHNDCELAVANSLAAVDPAPCRCKGRSTASANGAATSIWSASIGQSGAEEAGLRRPERRRAVSHLTELSRGTSTKSPT